MRRFSIRKLMAFVFVSAVGLAGLRNANEVWAGTMLMVAYVAIATAVLGGLILRARQRYGWAGCAVFGGGYLAIAIGPCLSDTFKSQLGTTYLLSYVQSQVAAASSAHELAVRIPQPSRTVLLQRIESLDEVTHKSAHAAFRKRLAELDATIGQRRALTPSFSLWRSLVPSPANHDHFLCVGHSLFALFAGMAGTQ